MGRYFPINIRVVLHSLETKFIFLVNFVEVRIKLSIVTLLIPNIFRFGILILKKNMHKTKDNLLTY